ncbi:hypothetical protein LCGC14_2996970 [marine sediment metagenome]|uniref:Uncharacterized protein n=1 Tax=marine sediment metagenome TaxID=412755 RepID=A0A0F8ZTA5_9ZZZZ
MTLVPSSESARVRAPADTTIHRAPGGSAKCKHWWRIKTPNGPTASARCKLCRATREYETGFVVVWTPRKRTRRERT